MVSIRRYARNWCTYLTCGGLVLATSLHTASANQQSRASGDSEAQKTTNEQQLPLPSDPDPTYSGLIDQRACAPSQDAHQEELCIEWRAAKAAEDQAFWSQATFWLGVAGTIAVIRTLYYTRKSAEAAMISARAADAAVEASNKTLSHARETAERDFRPWLTLEAKLTSAIKVRLPFDRDEITFFVDIFCTNVGKVAAHNIVYLVRGTDAAVTEDLGTWFDDLIGDAVAKSYSGYDSLAPSEKYVSRRWCRALGLREEDLLSKVQPYERICEICVGIVAAYESVGSTEEVFYTAKMLPVGYPNVPEFFGLIKFEDLPVGTGEVALGPTRLARTT